MSKACYRKVMRLNKIVRV